MFGEEAFRGRVELEAVFGAGETVAFVLEEEVFVVYAFLLHAATICSDSACFTRGSLAPWAMSIGILMRSTKKRGERDFRNSSSVSGLPTRSWKVESSGFQ